MKFRQKMVATVAALGIAAGGAIAAGAALAHEGGWHGGPGMGEGMELLHSLNLSDAQKEQARTIEKAGWAQAKPIMEQMHSVHEQMATALLTSGPVTAEQLAPMVTQEEQLKSQLDQIHLNALVQIRALLTPEQIAQAAATHSKLEALHEQEHAVMHASESSEP